MCEPVCQYLPTLQVCVYCSSPLLLCPLIKVNLVMRVGNRHKNTHLNTFLLSQMNRALSFICSKLTCVYVHEWIVVFYCNRCVFLAPWTPCCTKVLSGYIFHILSIGVICNMFRNKHMISLKVTEADGSEVRDFRDFSGFSKCFSSTNFCTNFISWMLELSTRVKLVLDEHRNEANKHCKQVL